MGVRAAVRGLIGAAAAAVLVTTVADPAAACPEGLAGVEPARAASTSAAKNVDLAGNIPSAKGVISTVFMRYGPRTVMFAVGVFGVKAYDITADPVDPPLIGVLEMPGMWEMEDTEADHRRKRLFLARDPRAHGGDVSTGESGIYVVDVRRPEAPRIMSYTKTPSGHTTSCINDCKYLWTGGPAKADWMPDDWGGRPIWVTDVRDPRRPRTFEEPIDIARNDGKTDYVHDVQVDTHGVAWASGRGGVRGYWTYGLRWDPVAKKRRIATPWNPVPYAGGGLDENDTNSSFMHNSHRPRGSKLIYVTEETFASDCAGDGLLVISSLEGSFNGEGWRSTPDDKFRLRTVGTWGVDGKEGSDPDSTSCSAHYFDVRGDLLVQSFYAQGTRFIDVSDPANPRQVAYFRPADAASWQPYFHGRYVYVADHARGVDILDPGALSAGPGHSPTRAGPGHNPTRAGTAR